MKDKLNIYYDEEGDFLELQVGKPREGYYEEISNGVFERKDRKTNDVIGIAIFNFKKRTKKLEHINISLPFRIQLTSS